MKSIYLFKDRYSTVTTVLILYIFLAEVPFYFTNPARGADLFGFLSAGNDFLNGSDIYLYSKPGKNNTWPPFYSMIMVGISLFNTFFGIIPTKIFWWFILFSSFLTTLIIWDAILKKKVISFTNWKCIFSNYQSISFLLLIFAIHRNFFYLQINIILLLLISYAYYLFLNNKHIYSSILFSFSIAMKALPGALIIYYLIKREWKMSFLLIVFSFLMTISPMLFYGLEFLNLFKTWLSISFSYAEYAFNTDNQSLYSFFFYYNISSFENNIFFIRLILSSLLIFYVVITFKFNNVNHYAFSGILIWMNMASPILWQHYFIYLLPFFLIVFYNYFNLENSNEKKMNIFFIISLFLIWLPQLFGSHFRRMTEFAYVNYIILIFAFFSSLMYIRQNKSKVNETLFSNS